VKELKHIEKTRLYYWNEDIAVYLKGVTHVEERKNEHRLRTLDGKQHVVPEGWVHLEIDATNGEE
jgi:hypothetical protein